MRKIASEPKSKVRKLAATWPLPEDALKVAGKFQAGNALKTAAALWEIGRRMDSTAIRAAADFVAEKLREAGVDQVAVTSLNQSNVQTLGGWLIPVTWKVQEACLKTVDGGGIVLADYAANPQSLAMYSPSTAGDGWVEGGVVKAPDVVSAGERLRGAFLLLESGAGSPDLNAAAAKAGALGVLVAIANKDPEACRYLNYSVPLDAERACVPCFSLSPSAAARLESLLASDPGVRLRARVRAVREPGEMPLVTGILGAGDPSVYLCAHLDEIGAQDNASGVAVALESLRVLHAAAKRKTGAPALRAIRVFFSVEVRGMQAWLNQQRRDPQFLAGLNLDMVGCDTSTGENMMSVNRGFQGVNHFSPRILDAAVRLADATVGGMATRVKGCGVSDGFYGINPPPGHVSLEQATNATYHSSADVPSQLNRRSLNWSGRAAVGFLYGMTRFGNKDAIRMAKAIVRETMAAMKSSPGESAAIRARAGAELESLRRAMKNAELYGTWRSPEDLYRAGVVRRTGCWPAIADMVRMNGVVESLPKAQAAAVAATVDKAGIRKEADNMVPQAAFRGFLSFEDHVSDGQREALSKALGMKPAWGSEKWVYMLAARMRGKATVAEIVDGIRSSGVVVDMEKAVALVRYLVQTGKARLRPILERKDLVKTFRDIGVKRGSVLAVHSSLSQFGYIRGGPRTVVEALLEVLGPKGTLCMPTHSASVLGAAPYDPAKSPSKVGALTEFFRKMPGVIRSRHPTHSVAAFGPAAKALTHMKDPAIAPLSRHGFWGKLVDHDGSVLLLCPIRSSTILHVGEAWEQIPQPLLIAHSFDPKGKRVVQVMPQSPWHVDHFQETMVDPLMQKGIMRMAPLGESKIFFAPARAMAEISVEVNRANPLITIGRKGACSCFYCKAVRDGVMARQGDANGAEGKP